MSSEDNKSKKVVPMPPPDKEGTVLIQKGLNEKTPDNNIVYPMDRLQKIKKKDDE